METTLIETARTRAGLTMEELANRAGTSRPTLSAYEHRRKSPRFDTASRIIAEAGFRLVIETEPTYRDIRTRHRRVASIPNRLPRLPVRQAFATVELPLHLDWSSSDRHVDLADRRQRARCYETVLREGTPADIEAYVDGALLIELWNELVLPEAIRTGWQAVLDDELG